MAATLKAAGTTAAATVQSKLPQPDLKPCFVTDETGARYDTHCANGAAEKQAMGDDSRSEL